MDDLAYSASRARRYLRGLAPLVLLLVLLALGTAPAAAIPDEPGASPRAAVRARAQAILDRLDQLTAQAEAVAEDFNAAAEEIHRLEAQMEAVRREKAAATERLAAAQHVLNKRARATYKNGGGDELLSMLMLPELEPATRRVLTDILESDAQAVANATDSRARIAAAERDLVTAIGRQQAVVGQLDQRRTQLEGLTGLILTEMRQADRPLRAALADLRREAEARSLADWAALGGDGSGRLSPSMRAIAAVRVALAQVGDPYVYAATGPDAFDCSGLAVFAYRAVGVPLPRVSRDQYRLGTKVALTDLIPGDLVFWADNTADPATVHHVAIYVGGGRIVHAPHTGDVVRVTAIWQKGLIGAVRPVRAGSGAQPAPPIMLPPNPPDWPNAPPPAAPPAPLPPPPTPAPTSHQTTPSTSPAPAPLPTSPSPSPSGTGTGTPTSTATSGPTVTSSGTPASPSPSSGTPAGTATATPTDSPSPG